MGRRNSWGSIRRLPSGRYQARYRIEVEEFVAPQTFRTKRDAEAFLAGVRADVEHGAWVNPGAGRITLADYAWRWLEQQPDLRPRTRELYEGELRLHILPVLGEVELSALSTVRVRAWHARSAQRRPHGQDHRRQVLPPSAHHPRHRRRDELILKNPCVLKGAGVERPQERPSPPSSRSTPWPA